MPTRRRVLIQTGSAVGITATLTGCSDSGGGDAPARPDLEVTSTSAEGTSLGNIDVTAVVTNQGRASGSGTLIAQVDVQDGDTYQADRSITLDASASHEYELTVDINAFSSLSGFEYTYDAFVQ